MLAARNLYQEEYIGEDYIDAEELYDVPCAPYPAPIPRSVRRTASRIVPKNSAKSAAKPAHKVGRASMAAATFAIAALFALGGGLVHRYERLTATNAQVNSLKYEIKKLERDIEDQKVNIEFAMSITTANEIASKELDMGYPKEEDIVSPGELPEAEKLSPENGDAPEDGGDSGGDGGGREPGAG